MQGMRIEQFSSQFGDFERLMEDIPTPRSFAELDLLTSTHPVLEEIDTCFRVNSLRYGHVFGFAQEQDGTIIQNLFPIKENANKQISSSSKTVLEMHTETAFHPWRPEVVILLCMRGQADAGTNIVLLEDVVSELDQLTLGILHQSLFATSIDESFHSENQPDASILTPVLFDGATRITYDRALMKGTTIDAQYALDCLSGVIDKVKRTVVLKTGQVMVINNRTAIHGRTPFSARYDGTDRWLKRIMVSGRLPNDDELEIRNGRDYVVTTRF